MKTKQIMKTSITIGLLSLGLLLGSSVASAQTISKAYTAEQVDQMFKEHKQQHAHDICPTQELSSALLRDFPKARDIDWEKTNALYEVEFEIGRFPSRDYTAYYDVKGQLLIYEQEIPTSELPAVVKNAALAKCPNFSIEDVSKIVKGNETLYKVEIEKGDVDVKLTLNKEGVIVSERVDR